MPSWADDKEQWAKIPGFPDYSVSSFGNVRNHRLEHMLAPRNGIRGIKKVQLRNSSGVKEAYIHRLVAAAFIEKFEDYEDVGHRDEDYSNNRISNLYLKSERVNTNEFDLLTEYDDRKPLIRRVRIIETGQTFMNVESCARFIGVDPSNIYRVLRGERRTVKGKTFDYVLMQ